MLITKVSPLSGKNISWELPVSEEQYRRWQEGEDIPHLTGDQKEFLRSGLHPGEFEKLFAEV